VKNKSKCLCMACVLRDRPSVNTILKKPLLQEKIRKFLSALVLELFLVFDVELIVKL